MTTQSIPNNTLQTEIVAQSGQSLLGYIIETECARRPTKPTAMLLLLMVEQERFTTVLQDIVLQMMRIVHDKTESAPCDEDSINRTETRAKQMAVRSMLNSQLWIEALSERESEVLQLLNAGLSNREIADQLVIALSTVKRHLANIYSKLGQSKK